MRINLCLAALLALVMLGQTVFAQPGSGGPGFGPPGVGRRGGRGGPDGRGGPGRRGGPDGRGGPGGPLVRAVNDLELPEAKRDAALVAIRARQDRVDSLTDLASAGLLAKMMDVLSADEFKRLEEQTDKARRGQGGVAVLTSDDVVARLMSFDKDKVGKISKDDLPERMQPLFEKGDTNNDGVLDQDEIKQLTADAAADGPSVAPLRGRGAGRGGRGGGGASPTAGLTPTAIERAVEELGLPEEKHAVATSTIGQYQTEIRTLNSLANAELLLQLASVLKDDDLKTMKAVLARQPGVGDQPSGPPRGRGGPPRGRGGPQGA